MLSFFPTPYEDELWYSVLSRYHLYSGNTFPIDTIRELFHGKSRADIGTATPDGFMSEVFEQLPEGMFCYEDLITKHTMFNYYTRIRPLSVKIELMKKSREGKALPRNNANLKMKTSSLKCCPLCVQEEVSAHGEAYWHVSHQPELSFICLKHRCRLIVYEAQNKNELDARLILPHQIGHSEDVSFNYTDNEMALTEASTKYLKLPIEYCPDPNFNNLITGLVNAGYGIVTKKMWAININLLAADLEAYLGKTMYDLYFRTDIERQKIPTLVRNWKTYAERFVILCAFLGQDPEVTFGTEAIPNRIEEAFYYQKRIYAGKYKKDIADSVGIKEWQLEILATYLGEKKFWYTREQNRKATLNLRIDEALNRRLKKFLSDNQIATCSPFVEIAIKEALDRRDCEKKD